jgi:hypothetical protein
MNPYPDLHSVNRVNYSPYISYPDINSQTAPLNPLVQNSNTNPIPNNNFPNSNSHRQNNNQNIQMVPTYNIERPFAVVNNQTAIDEIDKNNLKLTLKSNGQFVNCPYCKNMSVTRADKQCSITNVLCCVFTGPLPWFLLQAVRGKDINCFNADHYCTRCGNVLANYKAC